MPTLRTAGWKVVFNGIDVAFLLNQNLLQIPHTVLVYQTEDT